MRVKVDYIDNDIVLSDDDVFVIEIENKKYFYRLIDDLYKVFHLGISDYITFFDEENQEISNAKIRLIVNYFEFDFNSKRYQNDIFKYMLNHIEDGDKDKLFQLYRKFTSCYKKVLSKLDLPLSLVEDTAVESVIKNVKFQVCNKNELLDNLFLIIDLEKIIHTNNVLFFVNLKQYLSKGELIEFYKYAVYNGIKIVLIDSQCYGTTIEYERKLIIDGSLDEFVL